MNFDVGALLALLAFIVPMCFTPGPNNVLCAAHGSLHGVRNTLPLIAGMAIGWSILGVGIAASIVFLEENEDVLQIMSYLGAVYIAYLGYKVATSSVIEDEEGDNLVLPKELAFRGLCTQPLNNHHDPLVTQVVNGIVAFADSINLARQNAHA